MLCWTPFCLQEDYERILQAVAGDTVTQCCVCPCFAMDFYGILIIHNRWFSCPCSYIVGVVEYLLYMLSKSFRRCMFFLMLFACCPCYSNRSTSFRIWTFSSPRARRSKDITGRPGATEFRKFGLEVDQNLFRAAPGALLQVQSPPAGRTSFSNVVSGESNHS